GVSFHDGTPLSARHVVDSLQRGIVPGHPQSPGGDGVLARLLRGMPGVIREVRARDPRTVDIVLTQPYAPLLTTLAHPALSVVLPAAGGEGGNRWQGTGPFSITEIGPGRIVLEAQAAHWGRRARLARIVFIESADEAQAEAAVSAQSLDVLFPAGVPPRLGGTLSIPSWRIGYVALQTEKEPFKRLKARRALAAAGLAVTIQTESPESALSLMQAGEHQMALAEARVEAGDPHFLLYPLSASEGAAKGPSAVNFSFYRNSRLDDLLIRASQLSFRPERERLYVRTQAVLAEELPWIPIYRRLQWAGVRPEARDPPRHPSR